MCRFCLKKILLSQTFAESVEAESTRTLASYFPEYRGCNAVRRTLLNVFWMTRSTFVLTRSRKNSRNFCSSSWINISIHINLYSMHVYVCALLWQLPPRSSPPKTSTHAHTHKQTRNKKGYQRNVWQRVYNYDSMRQTSCIHWYIWIFAFYVKSCVHRTFIDVTLQIHPTCYLFLVALQAHGNQHSVCNVRRNMTACGQHWRTQHADTTKNTCCGLRVPSRQLTHCGT